MSVDGASPRPAYRLFVGVDIAAATFTAVWVSLGSADLTCYCRKAIG